MINTNHRGVIGADDIASLQTRDQVVQFTLRSLRETQRGRTMIKTPAVVLTTSSCGTATSGSPTGLEEQDRSLPATPLQGCHEGTAGQASADYGQINHLQIPDSCSDPKESEGRRKKRRVAARLAPSQERPGVELR